MSLTDKQKMTTHEKYIAYIVAILGHVHISLWTHHFASSKHHIVIIVAVKCLLTGKVTLLGLLLLHGHILLLLEVLLEKIFLLHLLLHLLLLLPQLLSLHFLHQQLLLLVQLSLLLESLRLRINGGDMSVKAITRKSEY